jgi:tetratricopeptide (TPR) repeat protein
MTCRARGLPAALLLGLLASCGGGPATSTLEEARVLKQAGHFPEALVLYEEAFLDMDPVPSDLVLEYAETALLACGSERSRAMRQTALEALCTLMRDSTFERTSQLGEMWRRLGWEMVRDRDSLQAYSAFDSALACEGMQGVFEEEWLVRGAFASMHLSLVTGLPDSIAMTPRGDSMLAASAEQHLVELDRIPRMRTDLRPAVLQARALLLPFTDRRTEELDVLTELDRSGGIEPSLRERRIRLLLDLAREDIEAGSTVLAREKLNEVWSSDFAGDRVEAAVLLGEIAERAGRPDEALEWYRSACSAAPSLSTPAAELAAARRDSLMFLLP